MNYIKHQKGLFDRFAEDTRISPYHISLYFALFQLWNMNRFRNPFPILREEVMSLAHIGSVSTYIRCMKQLDQWGYIEYAPSYSPSVGSKVSCITFEKGGDKGSDKAGGKAGDNASYKKTNITNGRKQLPSKNFDHGKEKVGTGTFHVNEQKDYSEPL